MDKIERLGTHSAVVLFIAPDNAERTLRRIASALPEALPRRFHTLLLGRPDADLAGWRMADEVAALKTLQAETGDADLVAYSGGAAMCLLHASTGAPIRSLTLIEPPWVGNDEWGPEEREFVTRFDSLMAAANRDLVEGFFDLFAPGFAPPIPDAEVSRMAPLLRAVWRGYRDTPLDRASLASIGKVLLPLGDRSAPRMRAQAFELARSMPQARIVEVRDAHHFDIMISGANQIAANIAQMAH